jgi:predicted amidohydrolase YtcJ
MGIVAVHEPGDLLADADLSVGIAAIAAAADRGALPLRLHASIREPALALAIERGLRTGDGLGRDPETKARVGWLKLFADGALGSRTALLLDPYEGTADDRGMAITGAAHLAELSRRAAAAGIVPQIHAIGDAALRAALDALQPIAPPTGPMARIEHVQFADPNDIPRLAARRIAASIQPIHLRSDDEKARAAWGERAEARGFLLRSLLAAGVTVGFGSDAPVEPPDPWPAIGIAVTRRAPEWGERPAFGPTEGIDLATALRAATIGPAQIAGEPDRGRLTPGQRADFVALPAAALAEPVERGGPLWSARPEFVAIDGSVVFER